MPNNWAVNTSFLHASAPYNRQLTNGFAIQSFYTIDKSFFYEEVLGPQLLKAGLKNLKNIPT